VRRLERDTLQMALGTVAGAASPAPEAFMVAQDAATDIVESVRVNSLTGRPRDGW
jgi:hypothetical protein